MAHTPPQLKRFRARGRFDVTAVFADGFLMRFTSDPKRSLPPREIVSCLREYADMIAAGADAEDRALAKAEGRSL